MDDAAGRLWRAAREPRVMSNPHNPGHGKAHHPAKPDVDTRDLEAKNEARSAGLPGEEPRNVQKAGGGTVGESLGGANTGRYGPSPGKVRSNREPKPRGQDKE